MMEKLNEGDQFPTTTLNLTDGGQITVPIDLDTPYLVLLFYRGHW
jgi:peroxiredoxin